MILAYVSLQAEEKKSFCWTGSWLLLECLMMKSSMVFEREALPLYINSTSTIRHSHVPRPSPLFTLFCIILNTNQRTTTTKKRGRPGNEASTQLYICDGGSSLASVFAWLCKNRQKRSGESHHKNDITTCMINDMH